MEIKVELLAKLVEGGHLKAEEVNETFNLDRVVRVDDTFIDVNSEYLIILDEDRGMLDDGTVVNLSDTMNKFKFSDDVFATGDIVKLVDCFSGQVLITPNKAIKLDKLETLYGLVEKAQGELYTVSVSGMTFKLPAYSLKKIDGGLLFDKSVENMIKDAFREKCNPIIGGTYNYIKLSECGKMVEYITKSRLDRCNGDFWNPEVRAKHGAQKKIRAFLSYIGVKDDRLANELIAKYGVIDANIEILEGSDIGKCFSSKHIKSMGSCMVGCDTKYFEIYKDNARALVMKDDNGIILVRALLWTVFDTISNKEITFMDRLYTSNSSLDPMFKGWAFKQGYYLLENNTHSQTKARNINGDSLDLTKCFIQLKSGRAYEKYPYIDTFCYKVLDRLYTRKSITSHQCTGGTHNVI